MPTNTAVNAHSSIAEACHLYAALDDQGQTTCTGNWTLGQIFNHLAAWAEMAYTGAGLKPSWYMRPLFRLAKGYVLKNGLPAGKGIPGVEGGTLSPQNPPPPTMASPAWSALHADPKRSPARSPPSLRKVHPRQLDRPPPPPRGTAPKLREVTRASRLQSQYHGLVGNNCSNSTRPPSSMSDTR